MGVAVVVRGLRAGMALLALAVQRIARQRLTAQPPVARTMSKRT